MPERTETTSALGKAEQRELVALALVDDLREMLKQIYEAEFGYGGWPEQKDILDLIERAK